MITLFPSHPVRTNQVDQAFQAEAEAAKRAGFHIAHVSLELMLGGEVKLSGVDEDHGGIIYRGWLMKPEHYAMLQEAVPEAYLITDYTAYRTAYQLPEWYCRLEEGVTPRTLVVPRDVFEEPRDLDRLMAWIKAAFPSGPLLVKDFVKSAKHQWFDACYISDANNLDEVRRVTRNFLEITGDNLHGGLCFREFVNFKKTGTHSKTRQPLINEWRLFMANGKVFYTAPYWAEGEYSGNKPDVKAVEQMCARLYWLSFVAVDVAEKEDGSWMIVEINDGGAAGVPDGGNVNEFYKALARTWVI